MMHYGTLDGLLEDEMCIDRLSIGKRLKDEAYEGKQRYDTINTKFDWLNSLNEF